MLSPYNYIIITYLILFDLNSYDVPHQIVIFVSAVNKIFIYFIHLDMSLPAPALGSGEAVLKGLGSGVRAGVTSEGTVKSSVKVAIQMIRA
jgi:hypothetical protein